MCDPREQEPCFCSPTPQPPPVQGGGCFFMSHWMNHKEESIQIGPRAATVALEQFTPLAITGLGTSLNPRYLCQSLGNVVLGLCVRRLRRIIGSFLSPLYPFPALLKPGCAAVGARPSYMGSRLPI